MSGNPARPNPERYPTSQKSGIPQVIIIYIMLSLIFVSTVSSQNLSAHLFIRSLEEASAPVYHQGTDSMIFTYKVEAGRFQPRHVGIGFGHELYQSIVDMQYVDTRDEDNNLVHRVYFFFLPITEDIEKMDALEYRYVVDGIWIEDPRNPSFIQKTSGRRISVAQLPDERQILLTSPQIQSDSMAARSKLVEFLYFADPGQQVFLAGNFNNWDPFMYQLSEHPLNPGEYSLTLRLRPGDYQYNYYYRGRRVKDPLNSRSSFDIEGYEYSHFTVDS